MIFDVETKFLSRWADVQLDGTMSAADRAIDAVGHFALILQAADDLLVVASARHEIIRATCTATAKLQTALALHPERITHLPFPPSFVLVAAVSQSLHFLSHVAREAIKEGANLAEHCNPAILDPADLCEGELAYQTWATAFLLRHLYDGSLEPAFNSQLEEDNG